jgi:hypothetical protein
MALSEISITSIFFIDQALPCADSHFLLLSLFFNGISAAGAGGFQ